MATKLYIPKPRRGLVERPRLLERLGRGAEARLTLVSAPAGFGKTTLLANWLAETPETPERSAADRRVAWLSLDPADNDPASFWAYVLAAFQAAVPGVGAAAAELLASTPASTDAMLTTLLNELAGAPSSVWLVLDDYHVIDNPDVRQGMAFLLEHLPASVHVVLSTRADPDLPLARWRVRGELVEIRAADLRFTTDEAAAYLDDATGRHLPADDVAVLEERTEGWIAALQLAALSLQGRADVSGFVARFAGDDRYVVDYLIEEVLQHQSDAVRGFLLQTAILDRLTGPLCDAVTGRDDGTDMLVALERANLFIVALDDQRRWYRYHHLFADVLRARLLSEQPDRVLLLHERASQWYERHDLTAEAIQHALASQAFGRAAHLMELAVPAIRRNRQDATFVSWLEVLPDAQVERSPVLTVFHGYSFMLSGDLAAADARFEDAERALAKVQHGAARTWADSEELHTLPSTIAIYRASIAHTRGDLAGTADYARRALDLAGPDDHLARGGAAGFLALVAWTEGDVSAAVKTFTQAVASLHAGGNLVDELSSTVALADMWLAAGRPGRARRIYEKGLKLAAAQAMPLAREVAELHVGLSELDVEAGDIDSARRHLGTASALLDRGTTTESRYRWFVATGRVARADGDPAAAGDLLGQAAQLYRPGFFPDVRPIEAMTARVWIGQGTLSRAADWARDRGVSVTDEPSYLREYDHLTLVRLLLAQHRAHPDARSVDGAAQLLDRLLGAAEASGRAGSALEIRLLMALTQDAQGHRPVALESLARAWALAPEPGHYVRLFLDESPPMLGLLRDLTRDGVVGEHARRLLDLATTGSGPRSASGPATSGPSTSGRSPSETLSVRELQVLRLLDSELTGPQIARELFVSHNTLRSHTKHIFSKLDVTSRRAAVLRARERGLM